MSTGGVLEGLPARRRVTFRDEADFLGRVASAAVISVAGGYLALRPSVPLAMAGVLLLAAMMVHLVELAHQCLHHSAFRSARPHRPLGVLMSLPFLATLGCGGVES